MQRIHCYILDVTYKIVEGKAQIQLFCRTKDGKKVCLKDNNFEPYFYAASNFYITEDVKKIFVEQNKVKYAVTKVESVKKKLFEKEQEFLKIFVNVPSAVPIIKDEVKNLSKEIKAYEYDIPFAKRYLLDNDLCPMKLTEAECSDDFVISAIKNISDETFEAPKILAIDIETYFDEDNKKIAPEQNPILMIALYSKDLKKVLTWKKFATSDNSIEFLETEAEMISRMCEIICSQEPDIIAGYYSDGFDFPYLNVRAKKNNVILDFGNNSVLKISGKSITIAEVNSIVHLDILKFIRKVIGRSMETDVFTLDAVAAELLGDHKHEVDLNQLSAAWNNNHEHLEKFCNYNLHDAKLTYDLCVKILPNMIELVKTTSAVLFDVDRMSFSQLVESFIMKNAKSAGEIAPNKPSYREKQERLKRRIKGAFVFEPKPGLYENIAVFDYRSLYPSIIASHNISPGTINCDCCKGKPKVPFENEDYWFCDKKIGFLSSIIKNLIELRAEIKSQIKKGKKDAMTLARSEALKVLANSFYGYLGFYGARWYCKECAESTTAFGRQYIHKVIDTAQSEGFKVIYSDTDSVFLLLDKKTKDAALKFAQDINKQLPGVMELDYEGLYPAGIFVTAKASEAGAKKKYALLDEKGIMKIRGFETVRRNWSFIAKDIQKQVLEIILKEKNPQKAAAYLRSTIGDLREHKINVDKVVIHTQLQREVSSYSNITPHVAAALRMKAKNQEVEPGTMLKFVIVSGKGKIRDKVRLPEEVKQEDYDAEYYINNQILPSVEKIFIVLGFKPEDFLVENTQSSLDGFV